MGGWGGDVYRKKEEEDGGEGGRKAESEMGTWGVG